MKEEDRITPAKAGRGKKVRELAKILIADDSEENLRLFKTLLKNKGYRITTAVNGEDALRKLRKQQHDLVLSDILMPIMDGFRLLQECKADPALGRIRFVFLTGAFTDKKDEELGLKLGADAFLRKPIEPDDLVRELAEVLSRKRTAKKVGRKIKEDESSRQSGLYNAALMQKLERKMEALEKEIAERSKAEGALAKSEEQYRVLFETMDQGVMCWAEGRVISANPAAARILGLNVQDLIDRSAADPIWKGFHEDGSDFAAEDFPVTVAAKTGAPVRDITMGYFSGRDDKSHWIRVSAIPQFRPGEDRPYQVYTTFDDITDRFFAFKALQESESRISAILENTQDAIWSVDRDFRLITANTGARRLYNRFYGITLIEGMDVISAMSGENRELWAGIGQRVLNGEKVTLEKSYESTDEPIYLEFSCSPIFSPSGRVMGASNSARDITERKKAEQHIRESEERHRLLVENVSESIYVIQDGKIKFCKPGISAVTGYSGAEIMSMGLSEIVHPDDLKPMLDNHVRRMKGEQVPAKYLFRAMRKDGNIRWAEASVTTIEWEGRPAALVLQSDITERREMEASIKKTSRLFKMLFLCNAAMVHAASETELFQRICSIMTETGGYRVAWAGYAQDDEHKLVKPVAASGADISLFEQAGISWADEQGGGPVGRAIRSGKTVVVQDISMDPVYKPWLIYIEKAGVASAIALPLKYRDKIFGSISIYSVQKNAFEEDDISLLGELAEDLAYGIAALREQEQRQEAEEALKKSEELFRKAVQSTTDIVWDWDIANGNVTWYGDIDGMLGYQHDEFPRTLEAWEKALHPDDRGRVMAALDRHAETGEPYNVEYRIVRKDGSLRNWIDRGLVIHDEKSKITNSVGACVDITEHRQSEAMARIRRDLALRLAGRIDMETALRHCLDAAIQISGFDTGVIFTRDEKSGDFTVACQHQASAYLIENYSVLKADSVDARLMSKGRPHYVTAGEFTPPFEERLRPEGLTFDAMIPVVFQGRVIANLSIFSHTQNNMPPLIRDSLETIAADIGLIIDRISSRQALQGSEEKYRLVVENAREVIIVAQDGLIKLANQFTASLSGYSKEELSSIPFSDLIHPDDRGFVVERHLRRIKGESFDEVYPFRIVTKDGQTKWVEIQAVLIEWEGRPATLNFLADVTERMQSEQRGRIRRDLAISLIGITDIETAARLCLDAAIDIAGFDSGVVYLRDEVSGDFRATCHRGLSVPLVDRLSGLASDTKWARLIMKGRPLYTRAEEYTAPFDEPLRAEGLTFSATIPVLHGDRILASLGVHSHTMNNMPDVIRNSLEAIAADIGIVIERIGTRRELQQSQERYAVVAENTSDVIWSADKYLCYTYFSPSVYKQRGFTPQEMLQFKMEQVIVATSIEPVVSGVASAISRFESDPGSGPVTFTGEMEVFCKDGSTKWTETSFTVTGDEQGKFNGVMGISRDITQRRRAEKALIESEQRYRSLFQYNPAMTYALDRQGYFTSVNAAAVRISGYSEEEARKMHFSQLAAPEYLEMVNLHYAGSLSGVPQSYEIVMIAKGGRRIDVHITGIPIIIDGNVIGVYGITEDISGRKKADEDLKAALEKASSTLDGTIEAIAMMSELRDPYTAGHQRMVSQLAVAIATEIDIEADRIQDLTVAGLLHDVGKVYVPSEILSKPGKLTDLELGLAKAHAEASYNIVRSIKFTGPIATIVWQHHERMDGSGYPRGLTGDQIMLEARILAVADVVEAMVSHRPYRPALGLEKALNEISKNRDILYDAKVVDACLALFNDKGFKFQD